MIVIDPNISHEDLDDSSIGLLGDIVLRNHVMIFLDKDDPCPSINLAEVEMLPEDVLTLSRFSQEKNFRVGVRELPSELRRHLDNVTAFHLKEPETEDSER